MCIRDRLLLLLFAGGIAALILWMLLEGHAFELAQRNSACTSAAQPGTPPCTAVLGRLSLANQAFAINLLLLLLPCLVGVVFGAPLVAGELEHKTNRLAWTQGISRTRWFVSKCLVVGLILVGLAALLAVVAQWWSSHTFDAQGFSLDVGHLHLGTGETRIGPQYFAITGIVPVAYTCLLYTS